MIAAYVRVSTDKQDTDSQRAAITDWLGDRAKDVVWYEDQISGSAKKRPALERLRADVRLGKIKHVVVFAVDRLSRSSVDGLQWLLSWLQRGVEFTAVSQPLLNAENPIRLTMLSLFLDLAQMERDAIRKRVTAGLTAAKKRGSRLGRPKQIPEETREAIRQAAARGMVQRAIAKEFGISQTGVSAILRKGRRA